MRFDPISFLLGFLSASGLSFALWRFRQRLASFQQSTEAQIEGTRQFIGQAADARYTRDLLLYLQQYHVAGSVLNLTDILLEPRLLSAPEPTTPQTGDAITIDDIFDIVPIFHDLPQGYAPFNIETMALEDLGAGDRHIAILGLTGMGKSTTLAALALMALGELRFETMEDITQRAISEEEEKLSEEERKERARERQRIQEAALEKLHDARAEQREQFGTADADKLPTLNIADLLPILVNICDLDFTVEHYGKSGELDPAEPLVRTLQGYVSAVTAQVIGSVIYPALEAGTALVLLDGYDDLAPDDREMYFFWLQHFLDTYGHNLIVIAGPVEGYDPLVKLGFTPTFLRAWHGGHYDQLAQYWSRAWADRYEVELNDQLMRRISIDNRGRSMLDVTLKIWTGLADDAQTTGRGGWYDALVNRLISIDILREPLSILAANALDGGYMLARDSIAETLQAHLAGTSSAPSVDNAIDTLVKDGILVAHAGQRYSFAHPHLTSYLASEIIADAGTQRAAELALDPAWATALSFAAAHVDMLPSMQRKLSESPDLMYSELFSMVNWVPDAPQDASWRGELFKRLAAALIAPTQYPKVRARAIASLIATRDRSVLFILRQALRMPDANIQQLACLGIGALGDGEAINDLEAMLSSPERKVQLAAGLALGALGTDAALELMAHGLVNGSPELRRAIAEALAALPGEGHAILRDGIEDADVELRRSVVYGLSRVQAPWALSTLYRAMVGDAQWYVRSAAEEAFMNARSPDRAGPRMYPEADSLRWLAEWTAERGESVPAGPNAREVLIQALQEGDPLYKATAAKTLGELGHLPALKPLYGALRDRDDTVRSAAYAALAELQVRLGDRLPGLM